MNRISDQHLNRLAKKIGQQLTQKAWQLAVAESCTGGWVAKLITDIEGSSAWFDRGFVTYSNAAKQSMLAVSGSILEQYGAVSKETVQAMAKGALTYSNAQITLAISGIAGPTGGTVEKPVGTVYFAWISQGQNGQIERHCFSGGRDSIRRQATQHALETLGTYIKHFS